MKPLSVQVVQSWPLTNFGADEHQSAVRSGSLLLLACMANKAGSVMRLSRMVPKVGSTAWSEPGSCAFLPVCAGGLK